MRHRAILAATVLVGAACVAWSRFMRYQRRWGATDEEVRRELPGDDIVPDADAQTTRAITVATPPGDVWPWLAQMGHGRGGLYSWDSLDIAFQILDRKSAKQVLPEFQNLHAGDVIPVKRGPPMPVLRVERNRLLVLGSGDPEFPVSWQTVLEPTGEHDTRLITRTRLRTPRTLSGRLLAFAMDVGASVMVPRWLRVLKGRAEGLAAGQYH